MTGDETSHFDGPGYVVLRCKHCTDSIARTAYPPHQWVHLEDEIQISFMTKITKNWNHEAEPDVIDVGSPQQTAPAPPKPARQRRSNPFY